MENNEDRPCYDEQNNERLYSDHVFVIVENWNSYTGDVVETIEKENQVMELEYPSKETRTFGLFFKRKSRFTWAPE